MEDQREQDPVFQALERAATADEPKIKSMKIVRDSSTNGTSDTKAYFLSTEAIKFRHEGELEKFPTRLFLGDLSEERDKVLIYYSSSGSGKTSELVGSSASRAAHLAIVISVVDPTTHMYESFEEIVDSEINSQGKNSDHLLGKDMTSPGSQDHSTSKHIDPTVFRWRKVNQLAAHDAILDTLTCLLAESRDQMALVVQAAVASDQKLKLVLAIDEASSCPRVIRGILRFPSTVKVLVHQAMHDAGLDISLAEVEVALSIGGTGVASSTIGSLPDTFEVLSPYHETSQNWKRIMDVKLKAESLKLVVPWNAEPEIIHSLNIISEHFPVLTEMMKNGRMSSIAMAELRDYSNTGEEVKEGVLVHSIVKRFMKSNGMNSLVRDKEEQRKVAASALAVHLFGHFDQFTLKVPQNGVEVAAWASDMLFFDFSTDCTVKQMVQSYGLLEPKGTIEDAHRGTSIQPPLQMSTPQQLIAVFMLGLELDSMLEPTWFGFELMSTHFVKCAIAASVAVCKEKRPSVKDTLAELGFRLDPNATSKSVEKTWHELGKWAA